MIFDKISVFKIVYALYILHMTSFIHILTASRIEPINKIHKILNNTNDT